MKHKLWGILFLLTLLLLPGLVNTTLVQAGDPDDTVGPGDPNLLVCVDRNSHLFLNLDSDSFDLNDEFDSSLGVDLEQLEKDCEMADDLFRGHNIPYDMTVDYIRQTRIEGYVFEFHPDPNGPEGWTAVRSRDIPVVASGPGFEIVWGSEKDGSYYFDYLGAGPVTLNLRLPPDAHPINPNIVVMSRSFLETWEVDLAFYRGNIPPDNVDFLVLPPDHKRNKLIAADTTIELDEETGEYDYLPNVGGVLSPNTSISTIALAAIILVILPTVGILKLRRKRIEE